MTISTVAFNGTNVEALGLDPVDLGGFLSIPKRTYQTVTIPGRPGVRALSTGSTVEPRVLAFKFRVSPTSFADRTTKLDALAAYFNAPVSVTTADSATRAVVGLLEEMPVTPAAFRIYTHTNIHADVRLVCHDPLYYDTSAVATNIPAATPTAISVGTGPVRRIAITIAACTNPVLILKNQSAVEVQRMTLTGTIPGGSTLVVDCDAFTIIQQAAGTNRLSWLGATETFFHLRLDNGITGYTLECAQAALTVAHYRSYWT